MFQNKTLQKLLIFIRHLLLASQRFYYIKFYGMNIGKDVRISLQAKLDKRNPKGVVIGDGSYLAFGSVVLCHDMSRNIKKDVVIGKECFIGAYSLLLPGVTIGDNSIVAAGAVVTKDVPSNCIVAGNPASVIRTDINTIKWGRIVTDDKPQ